MIRSPKKLLEKIRMTSYVHPLLADKLHAHRSDESETYLPRKNIHYRTIRFDNSEPEPVTINFVNSGVRHTMPSNSTIKLALPSQSADLSEYIILTQGARVCSSPYILKNTSNYIVLRKTMGGWMPVYYSTPVMKA